MRGSQTTQNAPAKSQSCAGLSNHCDRHPTPPGKSGPTHWARDSVRVRPPRSTRRGARTRSPTPSKSGDAAKSLWIGAFSASSSRCACCEFQAWFRTDADCLDYLEWLRWPDGFICPKCGHGVGWRLSDGRFQCVRCGERKSVTAGTIFDRTRTPLTVWFSACWLVATGKDGISALSLKRTLEIGSYQTAWAMLHRFRSVPRTPPSPLKSEQVPIP